MYGRCGNGALFPRWSRWVAFAVVAAGLALAPHGQLEGQHIAGLNESPSQMGQQFPFGDDDFVARRLLRALNAERQKMMISDAEKLLKLARELNAEIEAGDGANGGAALTAEQARKLANIEKLARNVKRKMSESVVSGPWVRELIDPMRH